MNPIKVNPGEIKTVNGVEYENTGKQPVWVPTEPLPVYEGETL